MSRRDESGDNGEGMLIVAAAMFLTPLLVWWMWHEYISLGVAWLRAGQAYLIGFDAESQGMLRGWVRQAMTYPGSVELGELYRSGQVVGYYLRWPAALIVIAAFAHAFMTHPEAGNALRRRFNIRTLAEYGVSLWPMIGPVLALRLEETSIDDPQHGMRQTPRQYAVRTGMVVPIAALSATADPASYELIDNGTRVFLLDRAREVFAIQLGPVYESSAAMPLYERHLLVAFGAQIALDNATALKIIEELARGARRAFLTPANKRTEATVDEIASATAARVADQVFAHREVKRVIERHAYRRTVLMGVLEAARVNGVLPPAWFRWLKAVDRGTWYALADLGMYACSCEAGGVRAQYQRECAVGSALLAPQIEAAVEGVREYLDDVLAEEEWT